MVNSMYNSDTELFFPLRIAPHLRDLRGGVWQSLVDRVSILEIVTSEHVAFVYLMARLSGCTGCNADSFRAMRGCMQCAKQVVRRFKGSDEELLAQHLQLKREVEEYLRKRVDLELQS
jgi:hypothetical protein